jgi:hypothetical protein
MEQLVRGSHFDWTIVRPPMLNHGESFYGCRIQTDAAPRGGWTMQRTDRAGFLFDEAEKGTHKKEIVGITSV